MEREKLRKEGMNGEEVLVYMLAASVHTIHRISYE